MGAVKLCTNKILQFLTGDTGFDLYNICKTVVVVLFCGCIVVKQVFKDLDFLGWYNTGELNYESDIQIHKQVIVCPQFFLLLCCPPSVRPSVCPSWPRCAGTQRLSQLRHRQHSCPAGHQSCVNCRSVHAWT